MNNWPIVVRWPHGNLANTPVLRLDGAGRRAAKRHIEEGRGLMCDLPRGLPDWLIAVLNQRERERVRKERQLLALVTRVAAVPMVGELL